MVEILQGALSWRPVPGDYIGMTMPIACAAGGFFRQPQATRRLHEPLRGDHPTLWQSFRCVKLLLWGAEPRRLVSFREAVCKT
jgi:hypothetical protein